MKFSFLCSSFNLFLSSVVCVSVIKAVDRIGGRWLGVFCILGRICKCRKRLHETGKQHGGSRMSKILR